VFVIYDIDFVFNTTIQPLLYCKFAMNLYNYCSPRVWLSSFGKRIILGLIFMKTYVTWYFGE